jgi:hypothetical protein
MPGTEEDLTNTKRPSTYRDVLCTYCKQRHQAPSDGQCFLALLDASERGEGSPPSAQTKARATMTHILVEAPADVDGTTAQPVELTSV